MLDCWRERRFSVARAKSPHWSILQHGRMNIFEANGQCITVVHTTLISYDVFLDGDGDLINGARKYSR